EYQHGDVVAIVTRDHDFLHEGRSERDEPRPQRSDAGPAAAGQLEVLDQAAVEYQAVLGMLRMFEPQGVAHAVVAFLVECGARELRLPPDPGVMFGPRKRASNFSPAGAS